MAEQCPYTPFPRENERPYIVAHRGISGKAPENSLAAFTLAMNTPGISMIELDVRLSKDDVAVVFHDRTLKRTAQRADPVRSRTAEELSLCDIGSWFSPSFSGERLPTLRQVFDLVRGRVWVNVEIKQEFLTPGMVGFIERKVIETVYAAGMADQVLYSSFNHRIIRNLRALDPKASLAVLYNPHWDFLLSPASLALRSKADAFVCNKNWLTPKMVENAHCEGIAVYCYTLNSVEGAAKVAQMGVDGILSDTADDIAPLFHRQ